MGRLGFPSLGSNGSNDPRHCKCREIETHELLGIVGPSLSPICQPKEVVESPIRPNCFILADPSNQEAVATSHILVELFLALLKGTYLPLVVQKGGPVPVGEHSMHVKVLLICSSGCFQSADLALWLVQLSNLAPAILPILAEPGRLAVLTPGPKCRLKQASGPYTLLALQKDMIHGPNFMVHLVLSAESLLQSCPPSPDPNMTVKQVGRCSLPATSARLRDTNRSGSRRM